LYKTKKVADSHSFIEDLFQFYTKVSKENFSFLNIVLHQANSYQKLESIINERIQTNDNIVTKNFTHMVTNAMLFIDVLAFEYYLKNNDINVDFFKNLERKCLALMMFSLNVKAQLSAKLAAPLVFRFDGVEVNEAIVPFRANSWPRKSNSWLRLKKGDLSSSQVSTHK
jgi:hypothetical protein